ncbi:hypothetical protein HK102_010781 [Quaeritorhiza haematococci]|nr:hypothetical protein HK102_010781 [Quaeritorhiza haematococci]
MFDDVVASVATAFIPVLVAAIVAYFSLVPSPYGPLPGYRDLAVAAMSKDPLVKAKKASMPYPEDCWPGSKYIDLPYGKTHYYLLGSENGPKVVFVHGITCPALGYAPCIDGLVAKGYRVLIYDAYGRGYSDSPGTPYSDALYVSQLSSLLQRLGWTRTYVVAVSLGGAVATRFASVFPEMIEKLVLVAPAGLMDVRRNTSIPLPGRILRLPFLGDLMVYTIGRRILLHKVDEELDVKKCGKGVIPMRDLTIHHTLHHPGFLRAFTSTVKHFPLERMHGSYEIVGKELGGRVLVIWGHDDTTVPYRLLKTFRKLVPKAQVLEVPGATHSVIVEKPDLCVDKITKFFKSP